MVLNDSWAVKDETTFVAGGAFDGGGGTVGPQAPVLSPSLDYDISNDFFLMPLRLLIKYWPLMGIQVCAFIN